MGNAWLITSAVDEAGAITQVWDGDEFVPIANINNAQIIGDSQFAIEQVRAVQGEFQSRFTDRDIRISRATVTVALV